jgi:hypothetical protein
MQASCAAMNASKPDGAIARTLTTMIALSSRQTKSRFAKTDLSLLPLQGSPWDERAADHARDAASDFNHRLAAQGYDAGGS